MLIDELRELLSKSEFPQFIQRLDFKEVYTWNAPYDYRRGCKIGYESKQCRILVYYGGDLSLSIATLTDSFDGVDEAYWVGADYLIAYLLKQPIQWDVDHRQHYQTRLVNSLTKTVQKLELLADRFMPMFRDHDTVTSWKSEFEQYIKSESMRQYRLGNNY